jgi:hypothetical protein
LSDSLKFSVSLRSYENERVQSRLDAGFNSEGDPVLEGYDIGPWIEEFWGDADYEYYCTVRRKDMPQLIEELLRETGEPAPTAECRQSFVTATLKTLFAPNHAGLHFASDY